MLFDASRALIAFGIKLVRQGNFFHDRSSIVVLNSVRDVGPDVL